MTVDRILRKVMSIYPHGFSNDDVIDDLNDIQAELFRTIYKPTTTNLYDILADNPFYPIEFSPSKIIDVVVCGTEYPSQLTKKSVVSSYFYYITGDNTIGLYPTPTEDAPGGLTIFNYKSPAILTSDNLEVVPDFDEDFHMLLVYRCCNMLAERNREYDVANGFISKVNSLLKDFEEANQPPDYTQIECVYGEGLF